MRYTDSRDPYEKPSPLGRFGSWLSRRSIESWGFFHRRLPDRAHLLLTSLHFIGTQDHPLQEDHPPEKF